MTHFQSHQHALAQPQPPAHPQPPAQPPRPFARQLTALLALFAVLNTACSSTHLDPAYNRYAPTNGDPTILRRLDHIADSAREVLDNLDERIENVVY